MENVQILHDRASKIDKIATEVDIIGEISVTGAEVITEITSVLITKVIITSAQIIIPLGQKIIIIKAMVIISMQTNK